jgi:hypothetical protein
MFVNSNLAKLENEFKESEIMLSPITFPIMDPDVTFTAEIIKLSIMKLLDSNKDWPYLAL